MENLEQNYKTYKKLLDRAIGAELADAVIEAVGGEEVVKKSPFNATDKTGAAFEGALTELSIVLMNKALYLNNGLPDNLKIEPKTIGKVTILSHISKAISFEPNDKQWEITNQGKIYKYTDLEGALRFGERSLLIAMNAGVKFTPVEFEAMRILDKIGEVDSMTKFFASPLSTIIRMANELVSLEYSK